LNSRLALWVEECAALTRPDRIHWCDGSDQEYEALVRQMLDTGGLFELNQQEYPGCYLHRSNPNDVARVEGLTYICTTNREDAGPTNNWMAPAKAKALVRPMFEGCMRGRTMYVVPYVMGPVGSPNSKVGVEITDSPYVVANMRIMTRMGQVALDQLGTDGEFVPGLHSVGELDPERRYILHFPEERLIWSYGSGYGGNALLGKKCFALRIASVMARDEGWMAEHMLILELEDPSGGRTYFAGAFPSACGKTNLAMLISPLEEEGYKVRTVGDDIAWMRIGEDGRLWAVNPEAGFFGVVPGTNEKTNPNAIATARANTIYTNVAVSDNGIPWWEGKDKNPPQPLTDWKGHRPWTGEEPAAHPNSRFTAPARQCPSISPSWEDPEGVPISGIIFGGRRDKTAPLVFEAFNWQHGTFVGASMASRTTAAAAGASNVLRRDPMAMLPFCGYNMGDYFGHWLKMGRRMSNPPRIFHVNWFQRDAEGNYLWPGYGDNVRVLIWMLDRITGKGGAKKTAIGYVPTPDALHLEGLPIERPVLDRLLDVNKEDWKPHIGGIAELFEQFGDRMPKEMWEELRGLEVRLGAQ
jgi:phosphoenolpyruvate carboxykinase (GTP)